MRDPAIDNLAGRSVFLTGHTGFKGSWLSLWLAEIGAAVTGYALAPPTDPSHFALAGVRDVLADHHEADLRDRAGLTDALRNARPDVVLHLAAQSVVRTGYEDPHETYDVNVMGTAALLDAVRALGRPCTVVVVTTDKVYENREQVWGYRETDALGGYDPYSASKAACDLLTASYRRSFFHPDKLSEHGVKLAIVRAGNVIGGGDFTPHALLPDLMRALRDGRPLAVRSPDAVRPWQHVLDCLGGYLSLAGRMLDDDDPRWCDAWNFGPLPGNELAVREVVAHAIRAWDETDTEDAGRSQGGGDVAGRWTDASDPHQPHEAGVLRLSIDKAMWDLGWRPQWGVERSIAETARWFRAWSRGGSVSELSRQQLLDYLADTRT